jgi:subtilisin family serine protease
MRLFASMVLTLLMAASAHAAQHDDATIVDPVATAAQHQVLVMLRLPAKHFRPDGAYGGGYMTDTGSAARRRIASELAAAHGLRLLDSWPMPAIGVDCFIMEDPTGAPLARVLAELVRDARVDWAQPLAEYQGMQSDPLAPLQPVTQEWHLAELHRVSTGRNVAIAVIDSGVDGDHPDLAGQIGLRRNFVDELPDAAESHGTAVAGIIGARVGNGVGIAGVAPHAKIMALRACWETGGRPARCNTLTLAKAINYALENSARVINLSLAGPPDRLLQSLLDAAMARGIIVVGAADPQIPDGGFPASYPGVIGIARAGDKHPGLVRIGYAPGTDIPSCMPGKGWGMVTGSSFAAAHVAGLAALMLELRPRAAAQALRQERDSFNTLQVRTLTTGNMDACAALARVANACVCLCTSTTATKNILSP